MSRLPLPARPGPLPTPRVEPQPCTRYLQDGSACGNTTVNVHGCCREPGCPEFRRSRRKPESHVELAFETCTADINVRRFRELFYGTNKQQADRIARVLARVGMNNETRDMSYYRGRDPLSLFTSFPDGAHLVSVTLNRLHPFTGARELISTCTYPCEHTRAGQ